MRKKLKLFSNTVIIMLSLFLVLDGFIFKASAESTSNTPKVILSEVNFLGSTYSSDDEWIELYNPTAYTINLNNYFIRVNNSTKYNLQGPIAPQTYFVISKLNYTAQTSGRKHTQDQIIPALSLRNTDLKVELIENNSGNLIIHDNAEFNKTYTTKNSSNGKYSLSRSSLDPNSPDFSSWTETRIRANLKKSILSNNICAIDFSTPGSQNTDVEIIFEIEDLCYKSGEILSQDGRDLLSVNGFDGILLDFDMGLGASYYEAKFIGYTSDNLFDAGNLQIETNQGKYQYNNINSRVFSTNRGLSLSFRNKDMKPANVKFEAKLKPDEYIYHDKIIFLVKEPAFSQSMVYVPKTMNISLNSDLIVEDSKEILKHTRGEINQESKIVQNLYLPSFMIRDPEAGFLITAKVRSGNFIDNQELNNVLRIDIENPNTKLLRSRTFKQAIFKDNKYVLLKFAFIPLSHGAEILSLTSFNNADIYIENITIDELNSIPGLIYDEIDFLNNINPELISMADSNYIITKSDAKGFVYNSPHGQFCLVSRNCNLEISLENLGPFDNQISPLAYIFWGNTDNKATQITEVYQKDLLNNKFNITLSGQKGSYSKLKIYTNGIAQLKFNVPKFTNAIPPERLISQSGINWTKPYLMKADSVKGINGQIIDILSSQSTFGPGKRQLKLNIKKLSKYTSGNDLIKFRIIDERSSKLFEVSLDENDLEDGKLMSKTYDFDIKKASKIYLLIYFYGNYDKAHSDIEVSNISV